MTMNAKTVHANFCLPKYAKYGLGVHYITLEYITHSPPPPPPPKKKKKKKKRRLVKMTQRYMLTIVGPGMFDFDI